MKRTLSTTVIVGVVASMCLLSAPAASASTDPESAETAPEAQVFEFIVAKPEISALSTDGVEKRDAGTQSAEGTTGTAAVCQFNQRVDYVHISSSPGARAAQSHGNWENVTCNYALADVTTQVDKRNALGFHYAVGTQGKGRLAPNPNGLTSGGAGRVTARYVCAGTGTNNFRSWTDIDIVGYDDATNKQYSPPTDVACG